MKLKKIMKENYYESGDISAIYVHDISSPNTIKVLKNDKFLFKVDADDVDDIIKSLTKLNNEFLKENNRNSIRKTTRNSRNSGYV